MDGVEVLGEDNPLLIVPPLVKHLSVKVQQVPLPCSDKKSNKFVIDTVVDLGTIVEVIIEYI